MKNKKIIYLAALANDKFGISPATVPLECGFIKAYALQQYPDDLEIEIFRTFRQLHDAVEQKIPDVIGCAWYGWNLWLTPNTLSYFKAKYPQIITVVGGACAPDQPKDILRDLKEHPSIEIIIPNEGEIPFVNLMKVLIEGRRELIFKTAIDGCYYLSGDKEELVNGIPVPVPKDINIFPSPYLNGYLDRFIETDLMPILQTTRGCPFHCTFCVAAKDAWNKVRAFDLERVKEEIRYLSNRAKNRTLRLTDENFGVLKRDLETAQFIAEHRAQTGYPSAVRAYTHKDINDRVKQMAILLKELIPLNVSFQSMTPSVLENVKRKNIGVDNFGNLVHWAHQNDLRITTEIIFGLPGETYQSFMEGINLLVGMRLDSVGGGTLMMLKEAPLSSSEQVKQHGYVTKYGIAESGYTEYKDFKSIEIEAWAVASNNFSYDDYIKFKLFGMIYMLFMYRGFFKELIYACDNHNVKIVDIIEEIFANPDQYPTFTKNLARLKNNVENSLYDTPEAVREAVNRQHEEILKMGHHYDYMNSYELQDIMHGEMLHPDNLDGTIDQVLKACKKVFNRTGCGKVDEFDCAMQLCKKLIWLIVAPFWKIPDEVVTLTSLYDVAAWIRNDCRPALSEYKSQTPLETQLKIISYSQYLEFINEHGQESFDRQTKFFFEKFKSNNVRRFVVTNSNSPSYNLDAVEA